MPVITEASKNEKTLTNLSDAGDITVDEATMTVDEADRPVGSLGLPITKANKNDSEDNTDATSPGTMADDATVGTVVWSNPDNAKASDDAYTTITQASGNNSSHYLKATNFGFSIPIGATITGIKVEAEVKVTTNNSRNYVNMVNGFMQKAGVNAGDNVVFGGVWTTSDTYIGTLSQSYLWGTTWTPAEINDVGFGYKFNCQIVGVNIGYVDHIRITVYYIDYTGGKSLTNAPENK